MSINFSTRSVLLAAVGIAAVSSPSVAMAQLRSFDVPAQPVSTGIRAFARQADVQILISAGAAGDRQTKALKGNYTVEKGLELLLAGTSLSARRTGENTYSIMASAGGQALPAALSEEEEAVPEIIVRGKRSWSLNTGIERTRDDSQPFVVFDSEDIKRSGSTSVEGFLRDFLNANSTVGTSEQAQAGVSPGRSAVNLRGLGSRETLILIGGRRQPGINDGGGNTTQPSITNIPLASIERIEVLASSAAGIYGTGATGGVINIILKRDYSGRQISVTYADTSDFKAPDKRIDVVLGQSLEGGRTNISFTGSYRDANPLLNGERRDFLIGAREFAFGNNPAFFTSPPLGSTPNIRSSNGQPLKLDPIFGGTVLGSSITSVPLGFGGVAKDGVAGLIANAGQYNLDLADTAAFGGARAPLIFGSEQISGTLAFRREMNSWLRIYGEAAGSIYENKNISSLALQSITLSANAPTNPFQQSIIVTLPQYGTDRTRNTRNEQLRFVTGAIIKLPYGWQAIVDGSYSVNRFKPEAIFETLSSKSRESFTNGTFDVIKDNASTPLSLEFDKVQTGDLKYTSKNLVTTFKIAGPVPIKLPGGEPTLVLNLERSKQSLGDIYDLDGIVGAGGVSIFYTPARSETVSSAYGEIRVPLIGESNKVPLVREFELILAGRYERYRGVGSNTGYLCFESLQGLPAGTGVAEACNASSLDLPRVKFGDAHVDPTVSAKWTVSPDLAFRASYATGYLTPRLSQLVKNKRSSIFVMATDPLRGNEMVGTPLFGPIGFVPGFDGGNPDVKPETSSTYSAGFILTPRFIEGLRFSADWTRIKKKNNFFNPQPLLFNFGTAEGQAGFETFLELFPERFVRGPASGGFSVGPIISIDSSVLNLSGSTAEALDFALDYTRPLWGGTLDFASSATRNLELSSQAFPGSPVVDSTGVVPSRGATGNLAFANGDLKWRGNASIRWSNDRFSLGVRARYFGPYFLNITRTVDLTTGTAKMDSQTYFDVYGNYQFEGGFALRAGVNNVFNKKPPYVADTYSLFGDPRLANFYLTLTKDF